MNSNSSFMNCSIGILNASMRDVLGKQARYLQEPLTANATLETFSCNYVYSVLPHVAVFPETD